MRSLVTAACTLLALAACGSPATRSGPVPEVPTAAGTVVAAAGEGTSTCTSSEGYTVEYPADWTTNADGVLPACSWFGPEEFVVPEASDVRTAPVTVRVVPWSPAEAVPPTPDEVSRTAVEVDGRPAVRVDVVAGPGFYPAGTRITTYAVELGAGTTLVADAVELPGGDHERAVAVLDGMVAGLELDDPTPA